MRDKVIYFLLITDTKLNFVAGKVPTSERPYVLCPACGKAKRIWVTLGDFWMVLSLTTALLAPPLSRSTVLVGKSPNHGPEWLGHRFVGRWAASSYPTTHPKQALVERRTGRGKSRTSSQQDWERKEQDQPSSRQSNLQLFRAAAWSLYDSWAEEKVSGDHSQICCTR